VALGRAQLQSRNPVAAHASFGKAAELTPASPRGPFLLGLALRAQGRPAEARQQFEKALAMAPPFVEPLEQLAGMSFGEKDQAAAIARVERQALLEPGSAEIQFLLGRVSQLAGDTTRAEQAYRKAVELNPNATGPYVALGQIYGSSKDYPRAIAELDKALAANPEQPAALMLWSIAQHMGGDQGKAREGYEKLVKTNPRFAPAANNLAWMIAEEGKDLPRAFLLAQSARDAAPQDPQIADTLGWVLYKQGAYPRAAALFQEAAEKLPTNAEVLYHLGMAEAKIGKNDEARAALQKSLELSAAHSGAAEAKAVLAALPAGK
jgi:Flp pilus assembly protein TadD